VIGIRGTLAVAALLVICSAGALPTFGQGKPGQQVPAGSRFLVALNGPLSTRECRAGDRVELRTLESLKAPGGKSLASGALVHAHVDKVEQGHQTGRARLWLTLDEIETKKGWVPLVATVSEVPGVHSVKVDAQREGEIQSRSSEAGESAWAAAAGALVGAAPGATARNGKGAAFGAAVGAATALMASSALGQEFTLDRGTKIELTLDRPLLLGKR
jgi:hypothetical protein